MSTETLLAISPIDGRYAEKTAILQDYFSEYALFKYHFIIEGSWLDYLLTQADLLGIPNPSPQALILLRQRIKAFDLTDAKQIKQIEKNCRHDVKAVEYFLKAYLAEQTELSAYQEWVHFGCTSEDINNLAYGLMLKNSLHDVIVPKLNLLQTQLTDKAHKMAHIAMLSRTHGQAATPTTLGKEFANFAYRLKRQIDGLVALPILAKFNGAVGNYNAQKISLPEINWPSFNKHFVQQFGFTWNPYTTQIEPHDYLADLLTKLSNLHNVLIDCARDCWHYISLGYFDQQHDKKSIGSSTMPHKINPIDFENAEGNLSLAQNLAQFLASRLPISRYQRDLVDSTLLRTLGTVFGHTLIAYDNLQAGLNKITPNLTVIANDLNQHVEVIAEAIQTIMRVHQLDLPYEQLKTLTQGQKINLQTMHAFIQQLNLPEAIKQQLLQLRPCDYLGYARELAQHV